MEGDYMTVTLDLLALDDLQKRHGFSNKKLANESGCSAMTIQNARRGKRVHFVSALRIARALGVSLEEITEKEQKGGEEA